MSSISSAASCTAAGERPAASAASSSARSAWCASSGAPASRQARSRYHRPASWRPWSSAAVCARRSARRACSPSSVSRLRCSFLGQELELVGQPLLVRGAGRGAARRRDLEQREPRALRAGRAVQRRAGERLGAGAQRGAVPGGERERALPVAQAQPRGGGGLRRRGAARLQPLRELGGRGRIEADGLAAAGDRRQHLRRAVGQQQQDDVVRRLLERLEQRVGGLVVHRVGALEHEHAVAGLERRVRGRGDDRLVDVAPEHLVRAARA